MNTSPHPGGVTDPRDPAVDPTPSDHVEAYEDPQTDPTEDQEDPRDLRRISHQCSDDPQNDATPTSCLPCPLSRVGPGLAKKGEGSEVICAFSVASHFEFLIFKIFAVLRISDFSCLE